MNNESTEILEINNFLSIASIKWEIEYFNILTGDMGAGKSLCIKLLKFFEDIIQNLLVLPYDNFLKNLNAATFFNSLTKKFTSIFTLSAERRRPQFKINYIFSYREERFEIMVSGNDENSVIFESPYLEKMLAEWNDYLQKSSIAATENITPDGFNEVKLTLYNNLLKKFGGYFPMATIFIPASRAALAFGSGYADNYLKEYNELIDVLPKFKSRNQTIINTILKAKMKINGALLLESDDGRQVPIVKASSGQQEIVYVLMLLDKLGHFRYSYGDYQSLFIEEPSAHLFPLEQKQTIELIVELYNYLKEYEKPVRFFITTHSPYILNSLNNMLKKGALLKKYNAHTDRINNDIAIPYFYADEISAYFISGNGIGENMLDKQENYMFADKIAQISYAIDNDTSKLSEINNALLDEQE
jgi:predicted ATPase